MIEVEIADPAWTAALAEAADLVRTAGAAALAEVADPGDVVVLLTDDETVRSLNARFRGADQPTNVLSFPAGEGAMGHAGDIALAFGVCAAEALAQARPLSDHLRHLTVHGVLHLFGFDHQDDAEAFVMERLEGRVLAGLGVPDPYAAETTTETRGV
jgi:probable rRNA maturation factor